MPGDQIPRETLIRAAIPQHQQARECTDPLPRESAKLNSREPVRPRAKLVGAGTANDSDKAWTISSPIVARALQRKVVGNQQRLRKSGCFSWLLVMLQV